MNMCLAFWSSDILSYIEIDYRMNSPVFKRNSVDLWALILSATEPTILIFFAGVISSGSQPF